MGINTVGQERGFPGELATIQRSDQTEFADWGRGQVDEDPETFMPQDTGAQGP